MNPVDDRVGLLSYHVNDGEKKMYKDDSILVGLLIITNDDEKELAGSSSIIKRTCHARTQSASRWSILQQESNKTGGP